MHWINDEVLQLWTQFQMEPTIKFIKEDDHLIELAFCIFVKYFTYVRAAV